MRQLSPGAGGAHPYSTELKELSLVRCEIPPGFPAEAKHPARPGARMEWLVSRARRGKGGAGWATSLRRPWGGGGLRAPGCGFPQSGSEVGFLLALSPQLLTLLRSGFCLPKGGLQAIPGVPVLRPSALEKGCCQAQAPETLLRRSLTSSGRNWAGRRALAAGIEGGVLAPFWS